MGYSIGADGWSVFTPSIQSPDVQWQNGYNGTYPQTGTTMVLYVSATGNDTTGNGSYANPYLTITKAKTIARTGSPDWILLKKDETFTGNQYLHSGNRAAGLSSTDYFLFGAYKTVDVASNNPFGTGTGARPIVLGDGSTVMWYSTPTSEATYVAFVGIEFYCKARNPNDGGTLDATGTTGNSCLFFFGNPDYVVIEDCKISFFNGGIVVQPVDHVSAGASHFNIRRSIIAKNYGTMGIQVYDSAMNYDGTNGVTLYQNYIDANDWFPGWYSKGSTPITIHNSYFDSNRRDPATSTFKGGGPPTWDGNIISRGSGGCHFKSGCIRSNNLWARNGAGSDCGAAMNLSYTVTGDMFVEGEITSGLSGQEYGDISLGTQRDDIVTVSVSGNGGPCTLTFQSDHRYNVNDFIYFSGGQTLPPELTDAQGLYYVYSVPTSATLTLASRGTYPPVSAINTTGGLKTGITIQFNENVGTQTWDGCWFINTLNPNSGFALSVDLPRRNSVTFSNGVIYKWSIDGSGNVIPNNSAHAVNPLTISKTDIYCPGSTQNTVTSSKYSFLDGKSLSLYAQSIGVGSTSDALFEYINSNQRKDNWNSNLTASSIIAYFKNAGNRGTKSLRRF